MIHKFSATASAVLIALGIGVSSPALAQQAMVLFKGEKGETIRSFSLELNKFEETENGLEAKGEAIGNLIVNMKYGEQINLSELGASMPNEESSIFVTPDGEGSVNLTYTYQAPDKTFYDVTLSCQTKEPQYGGGMYCRVSRGDGSEEVYGSGAMSVRMH